MRKVIDKINKLEDEIVKLKGNSRLIGIKRRDIEKIKSIGVFDKVDSLHAITKLVNSIDKGSFELKSLDIDEKSEVFYLDGNDGSYIQLAYCDKEVDKIDYTSNSLNFGDNDSCGVCAIDREEYLYILEFMKFVMDYRLLKLDYDVCFEELDQSVNLFVCKYLGECSAKKLAKIKE